MRRVLPIVLLAVALIGSSFMLTSANADRRDRDDDNGGESFRLLTVSGDHFAAIDVGKKGESIGDYITFSDDVYYRGKRVGYLDGTCTTTRIVGTAFRSQCVVTVSLPGGTLASQGVLAAASEEDATGLTIAITGGTGRYSDAGGEAHVKFLPDDKTLITVVLDD
jgi:hypothetical protein